MRSAAGLLYKQVSPLRMGAGFTCAFLCVFVYAVPHLHVRWGAKKATSAILPQALFTDFCLFVCLRHGLSLAWSSLYILGCLSREPQGTCLLPSSGDLVTRAGRHTWLIKVVTCYTCLYVCAPCIFGTRRGQKRPSDPLELDSQITVNHRVSSGNRT